MVEIKQSRDVCIEKLTSTKGLDLEITANLRSPGQAEMVMMGYVGMALGSKYCANKYQMMLRLSCSMYGRCRDDLTGIGKTPDVQTGWSMGGGSEE